MSADYEEYFGCECMSLNHTVQLLYFNPDTDDSPEDDVIYFTCNSKQWRNKTFPELLWIRNSINFWEGFWDSSVWNKIFIGIKHIIKNEDFKYGILDGADFKVEDLDRLYKTLSLVSSKTCDCHKDFYFVIKDSSDKWILRFNMDKENHYAIGWDIQFVPGNFSRRLKDGLRYIFNRKGFGELSFEIDFEKASWLKGMIDFAKEQKDATTS